MAGVINQLLKKMLMKFLVSNICHNEIMKCIGEFTTVNI